MRTAAFLLFCACVCTASSIDLTSFENYANLREGEYDIFWNVTENSIVLALRAVTTGWIGFGIGEQTSGSMPGADFVTGSIDDETLEAAVHDRFALDFVTPSVDSCQDWELVASDQSNGNTTLVVTRSLKTKDDQDRSIVAGPMRVLFAYGDSDDFQYHGPNNRGVTSVAFIPENHGTPWNLNDGAVFTHDLLMSNAEIPTSETTYFCQTFELPEVEDGQIIQVDAVIEDHPSAPDIVHHFLAFSCYTNESNWNTHPYPQQCVNMSDLCDTLFYGWAPGVGPLVLPKEAGFRIGRKESYAFRYAMLQVHYNNINHYSGLLDNSGIRIRYTKNVTREFDAGILTLGDAGVDFPPLAPGQKAIALESECPSECTEKFPHDINVFSDNLHMHQTGSQTWNTHWRNGSMVVENRVDFWDFGMQIAASVNYTIKRGDSMHMHCTYNTMQRTKPTRFGPASTDEMCMNFLTYYPIMKTEYGAFSVCGNLKIEGSQYTMCGGLRDPNLVVAPLMPNPPNPDPPGTGETSFGKACGSPTPLPSSAEKISWTWFLMMSLLMALSIMILN